MTEENIAIVAVIVLFGYAMFSATQAHALPTQCYVTNNASGQQKICHSYNERNNSYDVQTEYEYNNNSISSGMNSGFSTEKR